MFWVESCYCSISWLIQIDTSNKQKNSDPVNWEPAQNSDTQKPSSKLLRNMLARLLWWWTNLTTYIHSPSLTKRFQVKSYERKQED